MRRVYVETSVWGMIPEGQNPALRQATLEFLRLCESGIYLPCISAVVAEELDKASLEVQEVILQRLSKVKPITLSIPFEADLLAQRFLDEGVLPRKRLDDARHVACALVNELDLLVSWNHRHIANVRKAERFNAVAVLLGLKASLAIHTPLEVLQWE